MKIIFSILFCSIVFFSNFIYSLPVNNIDQDPFLRTWLFVGPFDDFEKAKSASDSLSKLSTDQISSLVDSEKGIEAHIITSSSNSGIHSIHQYFPDSNEKYIVGFSSIMSNNKIQGHEP